MKAAVETLAEATDVIGSQSRQEPSGIKHNRYAWIALTPGTNVEPANNRHHSPGGQYRYQPTPDENVTPVCIRHAHPVRFSGTGSRRHNSRLWAADNIRHDGPDFLR
jgi:hypothetical protein